MNRQLDSVEKIQERDIDPMKARYKEFLGTNDGPVYQAVIDFLYTLDRKHDYLCFFASYGDIPDSVQFVPGGNWYYSLMLSEDMVNYDTRLIRKLG